MWGAIAGMASSAVGNIAGGILSSKANRRARREARRRASEERDDYNAQMYADARGTAEAQASINRLADARRERAEARRGRQAVTGGTGASVAQGMEADAQAQANLEGNIVANQQARADNLRQQARVANRQHQAEMSQLKAQQRASVSQAVGGLANAGATIASSLIGSGNKSEDKQDANAAKRQEFNKSLAGGTLSSTQQQNVEQNIAKANEWDRQRAM